MSLMTVFHDLVVLLRADKDQSNLLEVDQCGTLLVNESPRFFAACTPGTAFPDGPCDALFASVATTAVVVGEENDTGDTQTIYLLQGINRVCVSKVVSVTGGASITAGYMRRPPSAP